MAAVAKRKASGEEMETVSKHPPKMSTSGIVGIQSLLTFSILAAAWIVAFFSRLFAVVRFESIIHEFDPWLVF